MIQSLAPEFVPVFIWYLVCVAFGWGTFPLAFTLFRHFPDRGFALAKTLGIFLLSYLVWISTSLGVTSYQRQPILIFAGILLIVNVVLLIRQFDDIWHYVKQHLPLFILIEGIFVLFFLAGIAIRLYSPDITGAEKEADFTLLNALLHSKSFPPKDTWFAGATINYYYFGYLIWSTIIHITKVIAPIGFNLALVTIVALSATGAFGIVYALTHRVSTGFFAPFLLLVFGNLDGLVQLITRNGNPLPFNWWQSSRVIPDTINEFPFFSFLLGDLHAHFMSIPFILLLLGLLGQLLFVALHSSGSETRSLSFFPFTPAVSSWLLLAVIGLLLGGTSVINGWDYPTSVLITAGCLIFICLRRWRQNGSRTRLLRQILSASGIFFLLLLISRVFFWPFYQHFTPQASLSHVRFVAAEQRTAIQDFLVIYGLFLWGIGMFLIARFSHVFKRIDVQDRTHHLVRWNAFALVMVLAYLFSGTWVLPIAVVLAGIFLYLIYQESLPPSFPSIQHAFLPYLLIVMAFAIVAGCEIVYIKDFYGHPLERQNTIFKFYYQAWIFLAIGLPYLLTAPLDISPHQDINVTSRGAYALHSAWWRQHRIFRVSGKLGLVLLCAACSIYPVFASYERAAHFRGEQQGGLLYLPTLNGISYLAYRYPYEYEALMWIQTQLPEEAVILEATGDPYSLFGRVASTTGRSTVLGWGNHEALWRDQTWKSIMQRTEDIKNIYNALDKTQVINLLRTYEVTYIYVGKLEKESYATEGLATFGNAFPVVYQNPFITIYAVSGSANKATF